MSMMYPLYAVCAASAGAVLAACTPPPPIRDGGVRLPSYEWRSACGDVWEHAKTTWEVIPQHFEGPFTDMFGTGKRVGCRFSATVPAGQAEARFNALKAAMLNDGWLEDEFAATDTTAGVQRDHAKCYSKFRRDPANVEIECFPMPRGWRGSTRG